MNFYSYFIFVAVSTPETTGSFLKSSQIPLLHIQSAHAESWLNNKYILQYFKTCDGHNIFNCSTKNKKEILSRSTASI